MTRSIRILRPGSAADALKWREECFARELSVGPPDAFVRGTLRAVSKTYDALLGRTANASGDLEDAAGDLARLAKARAERAEMAERGTTKRQAKGYVPWLSERLARTVAPYGYLGHLSNFLHNKPIDLAEHPYSPMHPRRDVWRLYLGLPQEHGHVEISAYKPPKPLKTTTKDTVYYRLRDVGDAHARLVAAAVRAERTGSRVAEDGFFGVRADAFENGVMGRFILGVGRDAEGEYASYYDRWDLDPAPFLRMEWVVGKPLELYDRIHFDRAKIQRILALEDAIAAEREKSPLPDSNPELEQDLTWFGIKLERYARATYQTNPVVGAAVAELAKLDRRYDFAHQPEYCAD